MSRAEYERQHDRTFAPSERQVKFEKQIREGMRGFLRVHDAEYKRNARAVLTDIIPENDNLHRLSGSIE